MADEQELTQSIGKLQQQIADLIVTIDRTNKQNVVTDAILRRVLARLEQRYEVEHHRVTPEDFRVVQGMLENAERIMAEDIERRKRLGID